MAIDTQRRPTARASHSLAPPPRQRRGRGALVIGGLLVLLLAAAYVGLRAGSGASLSADPVALARVETGPFGGSIRSVRAFGPDGKRIPIHVSGGRLTPRSGVVAPGERVTVQVVVRRPGSVGWLLGKERRQRLTLTAPAAHLGSPRITARPGARLAVSFDKPVAAVAYGLPAPRSRHDLSASRRNVAIPSPAQAGTIRVASAARTWEKVGPAEQLTWFPPTSSTALIAYPAPGSRIGPATPLRLIFSKPVGSDKPSIAPSVAGRWSKPDDHTLVFTPSGAGAPLGTHLRVTLPHDAAVSMGKDGALHTARTVDWTVPPGSTTRLHQLLAQEGYLPLDWKPSGHEVKRTTAAETEAAVHPPSGRFTWRYGNEPSELRAMWQEDSANDITRGAIMKFQSTHGLQVDGFAGPQLWSAVIADAVRGKHAAGGPGGGYSYVYVHRDASSQTLTLWHNGHNVITTPGNTGVAAAPTELGTFPVFEHLAETTMTGNNPDGSHYSDPGIKWVSYFNGGDALHAFDRASFGTPQSVGCVELPLASAAKVWPYTPIGTLVTIEH